MAHTPGVLHLCDIHGQGGLPYVLAQAAPFTGVRPNMLLGFNDPRLLAFVPGNADGSELISPTFFPVYDGTASPTVYTIASTTANGLVANGSPGWTTNQWQDRTMTVMLGIADDFKLIPLGVQSNTANALTFYDNWPAPGAPANGSEFRLGVGRFVTYNAVAGAVGIATALRGNANGSAWQGGMYGVGMDVTAVRSFRERVFQSSPYFHYAKFAQVGALGEVWGSGQPARVRLMAEKARIDAAALERGNTIDWKLCIIDVTAKDIKEASTYAPFVQANMDALVTFLRSPSGLNAPNLYVQIVLHHPNLHNVTAPGAAFFVRSELLTYTRSAGAAGKVAVLDMADKRFASPTLVTGSTSEVGDPAYYRHIDIQRTGEQAVDTYIAQTSNLSGTASNGKAVYVYIGDSIVTGNASAQWVSELKAASLIGAPGGTVRNPRQQIFNRLTQTLQTYDPLTNANTSGTVTGLSGPEISITAELDQIHGPAGFVLVKRGSNGSGLVSAGAYDAGTGSAGRWGKSFNQHYTELLADVRKTFSLIFAAGFIPDLRGIIVGLGDNDSSFENGGALFSAALATFIADLRNDLGNRTAGKPVPISWRRPQITSGIGLPNERALIRQALQNMASGDAQFRFYDVDDLERDRIDNIHETPESGLENGRRAVAALKQIIAY
jgi:hypothetical protein